MNPQIISFKCILKTKLGKLISTTYNRDVLTAIDSHDGIMLVGLSKKLSDLKKGDKRNIELTAEEAYGLYYPEKIILYPRKQLPKDIRIGETITIVSKSGIHNAYIVLEFFPHFVRLDGNHPLAGQDLIFEIETLEARNATTAEITTANNHIQKQVLH